MVMMMVMVMVVDSTNDPGDVNGEMMMVVMVGYLFFEHFYEVLDIRSFVGAHRIKLRFFVVLAVEKQLHSAHLVTNTIILR